MGYAIQGPDVPFTVLTHVRISIGCVYMPDLVAKRAADSLLKIASLEFTSHFPHHAFSSSGARSRVKVDTGQLSHRGPTYSRFTSSLGDSPVETPTQTSGRGMKGRKIKSTLNWKPGATKLQKRLRIRKDSTQSTNSNVDRSIPQGSR